MDNQLCTFGELSRLIEGQSLMRCDMPIEQVLTDSRSLHKPVGVLFVALRTTSGDGHRYIGELYQRGVRSYLVEGDVAEYALAYPEANFLCVASTLEALQSLARVHRERYSIPVVGITGSNGKTIVKEFVYTLLGDVAGRVLRSPRSYNSQIGVPLSLLQLSSSDDLAIIEAGISEPNEMHRLASMIRPTIGVLTSIGSAHSEHFASREALMEEKLNLFRSAKTLVAPLDLPGLEVAIERQGIACQLYGWSRLRTDALLYVEEIEITDIGTRIRFVTLGRNYEVTISMSDQASIENVLTALATIATLSPDWLDYAVGRLGLLRPISMRMEVKESYRGNIIINDAYCNDLDALGIALDFQRRRIQHSGQRAVVVLSDIEQSALEPTDLYRAVMTLLEEYGVERLYAVGRAIATMASMDARVEVYHYDDTEALLASPDLKRLDHTCILLKGARRFGFERIYRELSRLEHQTTLEIDLSAVRHNLAYYRSLLPTGQRVVCMIKADGYGIGAVELARTLQDSRVDYLAVAVADEGKALRQNGITSPIIVMNPDLSSSETLFRYHLEPEVYSLDLVQALAKEAQRLGVSDYPIHLKIDTGMHRLGLAPEEWDKAAEYLETIPSLRVASIFSHLASADEEALDAFTHHQAEMLVLTHRRLSDRLGYTPMLHLLNSAGIERFASRYAFDLVRLGIGLYGSSPTASSKVRPVARLVSTILQLREISAGEPIGYGCRGRVDRLSRIAVVPIGYADGLRRSLGNGRWRVEVGGKLCPTIGNICMDACMIDVTDVPQVSVGDQVVIFGNKCCTLEQMAEAAGTISYEILTTLSHRIQRLYFQE